MKERNINLPPLNHHQLTIFTMICLHLILFGFFTKSHMQRVSHLKGKMLTCLIWVKVSDWMQENIVTNIQVRWLINPMRLGFGWRCDVNLTWVVALSIMWLSNSIYAPAKVLTLCWTIFFVFGFHLLNPLVIMKEMDKNSLYKATINPPFLACRASV